MRRPGRQFLIWMCVALTGVPLIVAGVMLTRPAPHHHGWSATDAANLLPAALFLLGAALVMTGLLLGPWTLPPYFAGRRLAKGQGVVAAWRVSPQDWAAFTARDPGLAPVPTLVNRVPLDRSPPPDGVSIILGESGYRVGDDVYTLGAGSTKLRTRWLGELRWIDPPPGGGPAALEFLEYVYSNKSGFLLFASRLPVPEAARADGLRAYQHYQQGVAPEKRAGLHTAFAEDLAAARGDASAIPAVAEKARRERRIQGQSLLFGAALALLFGLWSVGRSDGSVELVAAALIFAPFFLGGLYLLLRDRRH